LGDYVIIDDILAPKGKEVMELIVPDPFSLVSALSAMMQTIFHGRGVNFYEDRLNWDVTADPRPFYYQVKFKKGFDRFTEFFIFVKINGRQPSDEKKSGVIFIEVNATLNTEFPAESPLEKLILLPFMYMYNILVYNKTRRSYINICKTYIEEFQNEIREKFGAPMRERLR